MAQYHPNDEWLAAYASGTATEPTEALIAAHLTLCPRCRAEVARYEEITASLIEAADQANEPVDMIGAEAIMVQRDPGACGRSCEEQRGSLATIAPRALVDYIRALTGTCELEELKWAELSGGLRLAILVGDEDRPVARLIEAQPGAQLPMHAHEFEELTLTLTGAYRDDTGRYAAGDVQCAPVGFAHGLSVETDEVCYAFIVSEDLP